MSRLSRLAVFLLMVSVPATTLALPVGWTTSTLADGATIIIDDTGLQWLSPYYTDGLSVNEVLAGSYAADGFEVATVAQFEGLIDAYGIYVTDVPGSGQYIEWASEYSITDSAYFTIAGVDLGIFHLDFLTTIDPYFTPGIGHQSDLYGFLVESATSSNVFYSQVRATNNGGAIYGGSGYWDLVAGADWSHEYYGTWLVRNTSSAPAPGAIVFLLAGIAALVFCRSRFSS